MVRNADITLYHKEYDPTKRIDVWTHAQYEGVSWHGRQAATVGDNGLNTADAYTVRIFTRAAAAVASGDIIIRGLVDFDDPQKARRAAAASSPRSRQRPRPTQELTFWEGFLLVVI